MNAARQPTTGRRRGLAAVSALVLAAVGVVGGAAPAWAGDERGTDIGRARAGATTAVAASPWCLTSEPGLVWGFDTVRDTNGALVSFWCDQRDGFMWHQWQLPGGGWSAPASLGVPQGQHFLGRPDALVLPSGQLVVFAIAEDRQLWHKWQLCDGCGWSGWVSLGGGLASNPSVVRKPDGVLVAFALAFDRDVWHKWQVCAGCTWSGWVSLSGGPFVGDVLGGLNFNDTRLLTVSAFHELGYRRYAAQPCEFCGWGGPNGWSP